MDNYAIKNYEKYYRHSTSDIFFKMSLYFTSMASLSFILKIEYFRYILLLILTISFDNACYFKNL